MERKWSGIKNILCIRLDNMGDLLMSSPAINALKDTFRCRITVLTSSMGANIARHIPGIDEVIVADVPWVKSHLNEGLADYFQLVDSLRRLSFDAAVIFSVFSQNPMPSIMLAYLAGIPLRLAYCRENPYHLLTHWLPDKEPYQFIRHQVERDLELVKFIGAATQFTDLRLSVPNHAYSKMLEKIKNAGLNTARPWIVVHPGASEEKRVYPRERFNIILKKIIEASDVQILLTGMHKEKVLTEHLRSGIAERSISVAGLLTLEEFTALIDISPVVLSVNTGTVHIAAALQTPVVVLYALSNPQHTPWNVASHVFTFPVMEELKSKNEVLRWMDENVMDQHANYPDADEVAQSVIQLLKSAHQLPA